MRWRCGTKPLPSRGSTGSRPRLWRRARLAISASSPAAAARLQRASFPTPQPALHAWPTSAIRQTGAIAILSRIAPIAGRGSRSFARFPTIARRQACPRLRCAPTASPNITILRIAAFTPSPTHALFAGQSFGLRTARGRKCARPRRRCNRGRRGAHRIRRDCRDQRHRRLSSRLRCTECGSGSALAAEESGAGTSRSR